MRSPRTFELLRSVDVSGVSGTGVVAHGCVFPDGTVALRWATEHRSTSYGDDWETCSFGWAPALTVNEAKS